MLQRLADHCATINTDKTVLGAKEIDFDGFRISAEGVRPLESHIKALRELQAPTSVKELRSLLGAVGFYMKFVPQYAVVVEPLRALLRHDAAWHWSRDCQNAFDKVIDSIASASALAHFNTDATTIVTTDASSVAIGACLSQSINGEERPVVFASRALTPAERNYSATEREALASMWACEKWNFYLYGRKFLLYTDHQALRMLFTAPGKGHRPLRLHRWADRLLHYHFEISYKSGERIAMSDYLSRMGISMDNVAGTADLSAVYTVATIFGSTDIPVLLSSELQMETTKDTALQAVLQLVSSGWPSRSNLSAELKPYHDVRQALSSSDEGLLMKDDVVAVPVSLRARVLELAHEGHPGIVRMKQRCRTTVWWPGMNHDVEAYVQHCVPCALSGKSTRPTTPPLQPIEFPPRPWHTLAIDIFGEVKWAPHHQRFLIVLVDLHSKWPEVAACGTVTSASVITFLTDIFYRHGLPEVIISDNGPQFTSEEFTSFLSSHGIQHRKTAVYNPTANGACERMNKVIKEGLAVACAESSPFLSALKRILSNYRALPHATTGVTPARLFYGRELVMPLDRLLTSASTSLKAKIPDVAKRVRFAQDRSKQYTDLIRHAKPTTFQPGEFVRTLRPSRKHKLEPKWSQPKKIITVRNSTVTLEDGCKWNVRKCIRSTSPEDTFTVEFDTDQQPAIAHLPEQPALDLAPVPTSSTFRRSTRQRKPPERYSP